MRYLPIQFALAALLAFTASAALGEPGIAREHIAGLGLQPRSGTVTLPADLAFGSEATQAWKSSRSPDYTLYAGSRAISHQGLRSDEAYGGIVYSLPRGWGSSIEAEYVQESLLAPRRYALTGQLHTAFGDGRTLSMGLKYRVHDTDSGLRYGAPLDTPAVGNGYTLAPYQHYGASYAPSYQLQMSYQHSLASSFGVALGREVETFTPFYDPSISGPRQFMFTGQHLLTPSWALSYDVLSQDAATPLRSLGLRLGVRYRW